MRAVNLLPEQNRRGSAPTLLTTRSVLAGGATLVTAVGLFCGVAFVQSHDRASDRQDTLAGLQRQVDALAGASDRTTTARRGDPERVAAFTTAAGARMRWDNLLDDVSRMLPAGSWLSSLNMQSGTAAPATTSSIPSTAPTAFTASGFAFSQDIVAGAMERLELVPTLSDVTLQSSTRTKVGTRNAYQFTLSANVLPEVPQQ